MRVELRTTRDLQQLVTMVEIIKELGLPTSKKVRFIVGTDEESGWADMDYYFEHVGLAKPDFGFSPDAEFPIINGEKGNITEYLTLLVKILVLLVFTVSQVDS